MRHTSDLQKKLRSKKNLEKAWRSIQENGRSSSSATIRREIDDFAENATANINSLSSRLVSGTFVFKPARGVPIPKLSSEGKKKSSNIRPIVIAPIENRIVQRALLETLLSVEPLQVFAENPYSFGGIRKRGAEEAAVPGAIKAVLEAIAAGGTHVAFADIRSFFTRISKTEVTRIIAKVIDDPVFLSFFENAIAVELDNLADLKTKAMYFPTADIGVAQGNCLSPLLGNIILHKFDAIMNDGDCRCFRYIDDFIIVAPSARAAKARMKKAKELLLALKMELSPEKSVIAPIPINQAFDFLGIEFCNGLLRPGNKARNKFLESLNDIFKSSLHNMRTFKPSRGLEKQYSLISTLRRVDGMVNGWGKHFRFCNDARFFEILDEDIKRLIDTYLSNCRAIRQKRDPTEWQLILGIQQLGEIQRKPLKWPSNRQK